MPKQKVTLFWFRRDLRMTDNHGLHKALSSPHSVLPIFIFDTNILDELPEDDARVTFIYDQLQNIDHQLKEKGSSLNCIKGTPEEAWKKLLKQFDIREVHANEDYEPYAIDRDQNISNLLTKSEIPFHLHKDQVIFAKDEVLKSDKTPYTVYTPYKNKWLSTLTPDDHKTYPSAAGTNYLKSDFTFPELKEIGFKRSSIKVLDYDLDNLQQYEQVRNFPALNQTSHLSPHLRFGTVSIRQLVTKTKTHTSFLNELIWREFFMQILWHFPHVVDANFRSKYNQIEWRNDSKDFERWKTGTTGYPMVDAGMRELNTTGYMHNRVRMVVASFLCKHLLIDWRWGEAYFAKKLLDYELSSNNGNWQWAAGTGCDAAPYFRVFNPTEQVKKFDPEFIYIRQWVPEFDTLNYPPPMVDHKMARERAIETYKTGIQKAGN